ncbi:hypothetical protein SAMN06265379_108145 [Saccharicrinis carchari]|uniref:Serine aminopeptidase S33 domain-containing protein n=1 Tax=Saccharicrinis carchari TaxID=1168039 RepID=A0A521ED99_SACCC|nr:alpha/beta hydrolase [Saccharicrinis carchari]SMO81907.1 hypothetical protein SAMN06265379_108145 [Saccharicrinis carchari]
MENDTVLQVGLNNLMRNNMSQNGINNGSNQWFGYYKKFDYFSPELIRAGCFPRIMEHNSTDKAIVLIHGLSDSPYFMTAIADHFYKLGYNVYLPLLHFHGLKKPMGMEGVELKEWKANVRFAINTAAASAKNISIGGLSTGGTLSFYMACINPKINGQLYLFSAALDLAGGPMGLFGELKERILRTYAADVLDKFNEKKPLVGLNPYRYACIDMDGAQELARLIKETDDLMDEYDANNPFPVRVFAAHSECDTTADINGIWALQAKTPADRFILYIIPKSDDVSHASVVLKNNIEVKEDSAGNTVVLEMANPKFMEMMEAITDFQ